jgi:hypothetical protein
VATASQAGSLLLGAGTLVGGIILGKVVVDAIGGAEHRAPGERGALDESIRLVASLTGISVTLLQLPAAWAQVQAIIKAREAAPAPAPAPTPVPASGYR